MKSSVTASLRKRIGVRFFFPALAFLLLLMGHPAIVHAQGCDNKDWIYEGGVYCISATSSAAFGGGPQMPVLTYQGQGNMCDTANYTLELDFAQPGDSNGNGQSYGLYNSGNLQGDIDWIVNWLINFGDAGEYGEGGNGSIDIYTSWAGYDNFPFFVYGQNPDPQSTIAPFLQTLNPPWWFGHALTQESSNRQFYKWQSQYDPSRTYTGTPIFGNPDGFGLAQVDGSSAAQASLLTDNVMWTWTTNLAVGVNIANGKLPTSQAYLNTQWANMQRDTALLGLNPILPYPFNYGACSFSYPGAGSISAYVNANSYINAEWITEYNSGHFTMWNLSSLSWPWIFPIPKITLQNPNPVPYLYPICTNTSATM